MTISEDFSALRDQFWQHHTSGRLQEALASRSVRGTASRGAAAMRNVPVTAEALLSRGHKVTVEELRDLDHEFPPDFGDRLPALLRRAREGVRAP